MTIPAGSQRQENVFNFGFQSSKLRWDFLNMLSWYCTMIICKVEERHILVSYAMQIPICVCYTSAWWLDLYCLSFLSFSCFLTFISTPNYSNATMHFFAKALFLLLCAILQSLWDFSSFYSQLHFSAFSPSPTLKGSYCPAMFVLPSGTADDYWVLPVFCWPWLLF
jgi:hypothetical protein